MNIFWASRLQHFCYLSGFFPMAANPGLIAILGHRPFLAILGHSQPFSAILGHSRPFSAILGHIF
jgi:hypothetical protein